MTQSWTGLSSPHPCDALIIVPPFFELNYPSLGAHVLQACARASGFHVSVFYANLLFASYIGLDRYKTLAEAPAGAFVGERLFARSAYGTAPLGRQEQMLAPERVHSTVLAAAIYDDDGQFGEAYRLNLLRTEVLVPQWVTAVARHVADLAVPVIGATTTFQQTSAAIALLRAVHRQRPETITIIGGANCEGEMAGGVLSIAPSIDYVFSGESEDTFPRFLRAVRRGERLAERIVEGRPCENMDALPSVEYDEYFEQRVQFLTPQAAAALPPASVPYETSRGCWWGQKQHCTFCGLNGEGMGFRAKSADRVIGEIRELVARYRPASIMMTDNIMPYEYFSTVVPRLAAELPGLDIFYEQKANLSRERLMLLHAAGVRSVQPGIEALSTDLLRLMRKGTTARQNVGLLRDALGVQIFLAWNLLWGFPGDRPASYEEILPILPLLHHLQPPTGFHPLAFDRFSPYFNQATQFGISDLRPYPGYYDFLPVGAAVEQVAYHFTGDYECAAVEAPALMRRVHAAVQSWQNAWAGGQPPELRLHWQDGAYWLVDTRNVTAGSSPRTVTAADASRLVVSAPYYDTPEQRADVHNKLAVTLDGYFVPLVVADQPTFLSVAATQAADVREAHDAAAPLTFHARA